MFCRPCGREHSGPECPVDELGRPSPAPGLVRAPVSRVASPPWCANWTLIGVSGTTTTNSAVTVIYQASNRPPDDDGLAGVPALVRR